MYKKYVKFIAAFLFCCFFNYTTASIKYHDRSSLASEDQFFIIDLQAQYFSLSHSQSLNIENIHNKGLINLTNDYIRSLSLITSIYEPNEFQCGELRIITHDHDYTSHTISIEYKPYPVTLQNELCQHHELNVKMYPKMSAARSFNPEIDAIIHLSTYYYKSYDEKKISDHIDLIVQDINARQKEKRAKENHHASLVQDSSALQKTTMTEEDYYASLVQDSSALQKTTMTEEDHHASLVQDSSALQKMTRKKENRHTSLSGWKGLFSCFTQQEENEETKKLLENNPVNP